LFSDIEGSTGLVKVLREEYPRVLDEHRRLVRAAVAANSGREVDTAGDGFFVVFGGATQAVVCALEVQRALASHEWPAGAAVRVRIGVHTGQAVRAGDGYTGVAVHRAARICAVARGGQVLISQATQALVEDEEAEGLGFTLVDAGEYRLKGLDRPVRLFELAAPGLVPVRAAVGMAERAAAAGGAIGFPAALTSFIGRDGPVAEVAGLLEEYRLVTVTGPGGTGKTRMAAEVARRVAGRYADGAWLVELAPVQDPARVPAAVAAALGVREQPGVPAAEAVARVLARQQLLLMLDNCEHVIGAAAELCAGLLAAADEVTILATSREPLAVAGEARYRLAPLALPDLDNPADAARAEAVALFSDRARRADAHFTLDEQTGPAAVRLVTRLDGMPLAIELAAARVEALGVAGLLDRIDDRFVLLAGGDRTAPSRQRSLAATVEWSYQLLDEGERRVFRQLSVFPGPFTLEAAEAVAGADAGPAVLHLVDCSLLSPPRTGPDGRSRYVMLETLRAYGAGLLAGAGEQDGTAAALAGYALRVAEDAAAGLQTSTGEVAAARRLDAEDPAMRQVLAWATDRDPAAAARLADAVSDWWWLRGRMTGQVPLLRQLAGRLQPGSEEWCAVQCLLGDAAYVGADQPGALGHFTAVCDAVGDGRPSRVLADALGGRSGALMAMGRLAEGTEEARRSLAMARELGYLVREALALQGLGIAAYYRGDNEGAIELTRQQQQLAGVPGWIVRGCSQLMIGALINAGDLATAESACGAALAGCRESGDLLSVPYLLMLLADLDIHAGRIQDAAAHLREGTQVAMRAGDWFDVAGNSLWYGAMLCTAAGRYAEAATLWAALDAHAKQQGSGEFAPADARRREEALAKARQALGPARIRAAEERGAAMSLDTAADYVLMLTAPGPPPSAAATATGLGKLSARERELVTLVAQGRTDAQIAAQLYISVRTVHTHLDRIRDKTGCRRRADLTRLALQAGLI
jgi:predicted ATPase/class 3 adenylate cyclase/DNA-binding CsgD family transcriptional regulator